MPDYTTYPQPPQDTVISGTGSAVQVADMDGVKWKFDDKNGNWVNLDTGEAVTPKTFSQMAGRSGNAARDTMALAQAMRREEASLMPGPRPAPPPPPVAPAPVIPPTGQGILPPYSAPELARVAGAQPVPSTRVPPTDAAREFYRQQMAQFYLQRGMKPADVAKLAGIGMQPAVKPVHVGDALVNPQTGQAIYTAPQRQMTAGEQARIAQSQASLAENKRQFDIKQAKVAAQPGKLSTTDSKDYTANASRLATIKKQLDAMQLMGDAMTPEQKATFNSLFQEGWQLLTEQEQIKAKSSPARSAAGPTTVTKPTAAAPAAKANEVIRTTKDGRKAVFDAGTRKFIRYADEQPITSFHF